MGLPCRIAIDASAARMGGGASRTVELAVTLAEIAPEHEYLFAVGPRLAARLSVVPPRSRLLIVPRPFGSVVTRMAWEHLYLPRILGRSGVNWVLSPFNVLPLGPGLGRRARRAVIVSNIGPFAPEIVGGMHGYHAARNRLLRTLTLRSLAIADHVFLLSREAHSLLASVLGGKPVTFLPMAPPSSHIIRQSKSVHLPDSVRAGPYFASLGEFFPYKGYEDAVRAIGLLRRSGHDVRLILCGNPMDATYSRRIQSIARVEAPHAVTFMKGVSQPEALALMSSSIATVICSRVENPGRVPIEAMALGSPVVAADIRSIRDSCGEAAIYYQPGDYRRLADLMHEILEDPVARADVSLRGRERVAGLDGMSATRILLEALDL